MKRLIPLLISYLLLCGAALVGQDSGSGATPDLILRDQAVVVLVVAVLSAWSWVIIMC